MPTQNSLENTYRKQLGLTLIELMVALAIGSFLVIGSIQIYSQSREAFIINESIARVQQLGPHKSRSRDRKSQHRR